jgi:Putative esterase
MATTTAPGDKSNMVVTTSHPGTWTRTITVYLPANYVPGTEAPFIVLGDGGSTAYRDLSAILDSLIQQRRVPPMIAIQIGNGGQDAQGSERGREYDTVSGTYTQFVEREVLPLVEQQTGAKLTKNPDGRATMGLSSSGAAAFTMAWFHPELYRRVLAYSPTMVNQQWPYDPSLRGGAWEYHSPWAGPAGPNLNIKAGVTSPSEPPGSPLIPSVPTKPIRYWFAMGDQDLFYPNPVMADGMHDWVLSAERMAKVLADKGYHYQFVFARNSKHVDRPTVAQTFPAALEWLWKGYPIP